VIERDERQWRAMLDGRVDELIGWLAPQAIEDLTIGRPDLETLFRRYYQTEADAGQERVK
jgi:hypothetical protein